MSSNIKKMGPEHWKGETPTLERAASTTSHAAESSLTFLWYYLLDGDAHLEIRSAAVHNLITVSRALLYITIASYLQLGGCQNSGPLVGP